ncbi:MAG: hypothetical protein FJ115_05550 [Deltaproteobacteria bacterium]|nr:hypothetical protein [Deltaproteobacteria bacterium]
MGTGHVSPTESLKLAEYCSEVGFNKLVLTHPLSLGVSIHEIEKMAKLGCYIELTCLHVMLHIVKVKQVLDIIERIGCPKCLLTTDSFFSWTPPEPEMFRLFVGLLNFEGLEPKIIRIMVYDNPRQLLEIN